MIPFKYHSKLGWFYRNERIVVTCEGCWGGRQQKGVFWGADNIPHFDPGSGFTDVLACKASSSSAFKITTFYSVYVIFNSNVYQTKTSISAPALSLGCIASQVPDTRNQTIPIELPLYVPTIHLLSPGLSNLLAEYPGLSIINCLPIFPSVPLPDSWSCLSYIHYKHNLGLSKEPQSKCWSSDKMRSASFLPILPTE